jgi:hypothetical protein
LRKWAFFKEDYWAVKGSHICCKCRQDKGIYLD